MIKNILVAYDGSKNADQAFDFALDIASKYKAKMVVLSVARPSEPPEDVETEAVLENATEHFEKLFLVLRKKAQKHSLTPKFMVRVGHPADQIVNFANEDKTDLIVMGHRGKSVVERWLLGSISKRVLSYARCTVSIVR